MSEHLRIDPRAPALGDQPDGDLANCDRANCDQSGANDASGAGISRRGLFGAAGGLAVATAAGTALSACSKSSGGADARDDDDYSPQFFQPDEWAFVRAAVDRLIPADALGGGALAAGVPGFIDRQMLTPYGLGKHNYMQGPFAPDAPPEFGYQGPLVPQQIYRLGIADASAHASQTTGKGFTDLPPDQIDRLLKSWEAGEAQFKQLPSKLFFGQLLGDTKQGFFCDPIHGGNRNMIGWTLIGFPGARADYIDWVDRNERYPLPPVSINGSRPRT